MANIPFVENFDNSHTKPKQPITTTMELPPHKSKVQSSAYHPHIPNYHPSQGIQTPSATDVICGRGKMTVAHPGNRRFRELVMEKKEAYQRARRRDDKTRITSELVQKLRSGPDGGRFLLFDPKTKLWYDVGDDYAREKVSHSLRSRPNEQRRIKPKPRKKTVRKANHSPALDAVVSRLIHDQQALLKTMIERETNRAAAEAASNDANTNSMDYAEV